jgi:uncharacterized protein
MKSLLKHFPIPIVLTLIVWFLIGGYLGFAAFVTVIILTFLEISLSVDNAVVNSRVLVQMSQFWQRLFMTLGIFIAVFVIRFALPIIIVATSASLGIGDVLNLALNQPQEYGHKLHDAAPMINAFGGIFLVMVGVYFFIDRTRTRTWLVPERLLARLDRLPFVKALIIITLALIVYINVQPADREIVGTALIVALAAYWLLHGVTLLMERLHKTSNAALMKTGFQAFMAFLYLEVLDASFSLDGVIGAFAITDNIFIIMGGLGVGAIWVRAITLHLVKSGTLIRYKFLESGAHWAILLLGVIMLAKLFNIEPPEWVIGSVGLVMIGLAIYSSKKVKTL